MAKKGEEWIKKVLEDQGFQLEKFGREDVYAYKENLSLVIDDKDWKDEVSVFKNNIYQRTTRFRNERKPKGQLIKYAFNINKELERRKVFRQIVCVYVFSNLKGRVVQPISYGKYGTIFVVSRNYFPVWLKYMQKLYFGDPVDLGSGYLGGK